MKEVFREKHDIYRDIVPGVIYVVCENEDPFPYDINNLSRKTRSSKRTYFSKLGNPVITKISICICGKRKNNRKMRSPYCYECSKEIRTFGSIEVQTKKILERVRAKPAINEKASRAITDCIKRVPKCLIKYQKAKFIPCDGCKEYVPMDIEHINQEADGFNDVSGRV